MTIFRNSIFYLFFWSLAHLLAAQPGQIDIPRVELMPDEPAPYNVRDWEEVAMQYDSFIYDVDLSGQYLPLCFLMPSGVNYPQNGSFRLHTYVGTNSPFGNEAINVLPSLVGASLVGIDKSNQFGQNWVLMSQDFYNKANGEDIYLNNAGASSGGDWWYDMMPNVFFYQLYDLYPDIGGEEELQFISIAERFHEAVQAMGGSETPWQAAYMNYRAWDFQSMQPNTNGVPEPEAAGAFAWVLYHAWKESGNPEYLKAAEWSIEFLDGWDSNPSYELQLPYGTLIAAKMNAELGTDYDVEKMVNWSFNKGELRQWGTIVGNWGGFDVSGLVGEAKDDGNDYAFQLNGMQQAAALLPMVRYDKRFARAIGKWMLNLANASRLFYHGFLPASLQDASDWSEDYDPDQVVGYEALREVWQGNSPYSTGDAVNGGWAATNLALYGTSSVGYLGALIDKTNTLKILQLDLLATDFFKEEAYPTYLYYNPYNSPKTVELDAGTDPVDIYEALSETFLQENVSGAVQLTIPPYEAIMVTLAPAGGAITYELNRMLIDGVVVDYRQSAQSFTYPPRIKGLAAYSDPLQIGDTTTLYATVSDADSDQFTFQWGVVLGTLGGTGSELLYTAPSDPGLDLIGCIVTDPDGNADTAFFELNIVPEINEAPQILGILKEEPFTAPGGTVELICQALDPNNDTLTYNWTATGGTISGSGDTVQWTAPAMEGIYQIDVEVFDEEDLSTSAGTNMLVKVFTASGGDLIGHYPFTGNADDVSGNELHGQVNGALLTNDLFGQPQEAYYFNGGPQHIAVPNDALLNFQDAITLSCWFNPYDLPDKETFLLSHGSWQNRWKLSITPDKLLRWTVNTETGIADLDAGRPLEVDSFYHVAVTYEGELLAMYLNGALHSYTNLSGPIRTTTNPFLIGQMLPDNFTYNFKGVVDDVRIYDYALIPDSVNELYLQYLTDLKEPEQGAVEPLLVFPNPVSETLTIRLSEPLRGNALLQVYDLAGRMLVNETCEGVSWKELNVRHFEPGMYIITCSSKEINVTAKFIKF